MTFVSHLLYLSFNQSTLEWFDTKEEAKQWHHNFFRLDDHLLVSQEESRCYLGLFNNVLVVLSEHCDLSLNEIRPDFILVQRFYGFNWVSLRPKKWGEWGDYIDWVSGNTNDLVGLEGHRPLNLWVVGLHDPSRFVDSLLAEHTFLLEGQGE